MGGTGGHVPQLMDRGAHNIVCPPQYFVIKSNLVVQISWLHYCWKCFPNIKPGNKWEKLALSLDSLQKQDTDFLCKLNCHDCWKLCWLISLTESVCTWTSLNQEFLLWSVARNQNTIATRLIAEGGTTWQCHPQFQSFQVNKIFEV